MNTPKGSLASQDHELHVQDLAPHFVYARFCSLALAKKDGPKNHLTVLITRTGPHATFVYINEARSFIAD